MTWIVLSLLIVLLSYLCRQGVVPVRVTKKEKKKRRKHKSLRRANSSKYVNPRAKRKWRKK